MVGLTHNQLLFIAAAVTIALTLNVIGPLVLLFLVPLGALVIIRRLDVNTVILVFVTVVAVRLVLDSFLPAMAFREMVSFIAAYLAAAFLWVR